MSQSVRIIHCDLYNFHQSSLAFATSKSSILEGPQQANGAAHEYEEPPPCARAANRARDKARSCFNLTRALLASLSKPTAQCRVRAGAGTIIASDP